MTEYMTGVFVASGFFSLLGHLSYRSSLDGVRRFALGLILFFITASPAIELIGSLAELDISELIPDAGADIEEDRGIYEESFREGIASAVAEKFGLNRKDIRVITEGFSSSEWRCGKIRIVLSGGGALADYHAVEDYVNRLNIGECEAEIEIG